MARKRDDIDQDLEKDFDDIDDSVLKEAPPESSKSTRKGRTSTASNTVRKNSPRASTILSGKSASEQDSQGDSGTIMILLVTSIVYVCIVLYLIWSRWFATALLVGAAGMIGYFLYLFTGAINRVKLHGMVVYCYLFTSAALIGAVLPFFYFKTVILNDDNMLKTPLGIISACVAAKGDEAQQIPREISCKYQNKQWVVNFGGTVKTRYLSKCQTTDVSCRNEEIKKYPERYSNDNIQVTGGLVVPLYVLIIAIIGAAVNMTRRVPEYQRQVYAYINNDHEHDDELDTISPEDAREFMVFQLMQVISAPIIAITAYYFLVPNSYTTSVLLGFFAGFASETILVTLRALADRLLPGVQARSRIKSAKAK